MKKVKVGVVGVGRGMYMINYCKISDNAELVAICDKWEEALEHRKEQLAELNITGYTDYDEFLNHDMDVVILANYANEHAPFAIKAMKKGFHVISEVLPCQTMKEAVELIETIEETGKVYCYAENYCYMPALREMRKLYKEGKLGEIEYAEGEYVHNCETIWSDITYGDRTHWRNNMYATFYCTHSLGPLVHVSGLRPVKVTGFELPIRERLARQGRCSGTAGIEMVTMENGAVFKSIHGDLKINSIWYSVYGTKGRLESARECTHVGRESRLFVELYEKEDDYSNLNEYNCAPGANAKDADKANKFGHGGSDFYAMYESIEKIRGNDKAEAIDVFEALDMFLPGHFAYRSILNGGIPMDIPNLRNKEERNKWRNDTLCCDPNVAGDMLVPSYSKGNPDYPDELYENTKKKWLEDIFKHHG